MGVIYNSIEVSLYIVHNLFAYIYILLCGSQLSKKHKIKMICLEYIEYEVYKKTDVIVWTLDIKKLLNY